LVVALLLAADFPAENPRAQNRNIPYTRPLAVITQHTKNLNSKQKNQSVLNRIEREKLTRNLNFKALK